MQKVIHKLREYERRLLRHRHAKAVIVSGTAVLAVCACWGILALSLKADTSTTASFDPESSTRNGVTIMQDSSATGGSAIKFGATTGPTPTVVLTITGSDKRQEMDGFGIAANSERWIGNELKPVVDRFINEQGTTLWRVIIDEEDWETTNDNGDPNTFNWTYYNSVFTSAKFEKLWALMAYLNSKGVNDDLILSFMGQGPGWMGGHNLNSNAEDEWVETVAAVAYYAKNTRGLQFGKFSPNNEPDVTDVVEGVLMDPDKTARVYGKLARKLDAIGMSDLKLIAPDLSSVVGGLRNYAPELYADPVLAPKIAAISVHRYGGGIDDAATDINNFRSNYPGKKFWMSEYGNFNDIWQHITRWPSASMFWEGYDSVYQHAIRNGLGNTPPNDSFQPSLLTYHSGTYSPDTRDYYRIGQLYRWVPKGSRYVGSASSKSNVSVRAFTHDAKGYVTVVGWNSASSSQVVGGSLSGAPAVSTLKVHFTSNSGSTYNMSRQSDVTVSGDSFTVSVPANTIFTLTNVP